MGHPAERESADFDGEAAGHGGGAAAGRDQGLPAVSARPIASGGCTGGWAESTRAGASDSRGDRAACGTDWGGERLEVRGERSDVRGLFTSAIRPPTFALAITQVLTRLAQKMRQ